MTNARRPIHLQLRPNSLAVKLSAACSPKALSPTGDSLPSQILPHLFVGNQEQTNRETVNRLNISYILSLGLLPLISNNTSPSSPTSSSRAQVMPSQNSSKDFKIRIRLSGGNSSSNGNGNCGVGSGGAGIGGTGGGNSDNQTPTRKPLDRDENKGVKVIRSVHCKCINIADNSEQSLAKFFDEAHQFIDEARRRKCNILVHCLAGISRSPTIAIAYLMRVNSLRLQDAYNLVKQCRPQIDPNLSFISQLMVYERSLDDKQGRSTSLKLTN